MTSRMTDSITLLDIMEARRLMRDAGPQSPRHILSSVEALHWCHLSDHKLRVCSHCRGDHDNCRRLLSEFPA